MPTASVPRKSPRAPKICHHKNTGQAYVNLAGHRHYLGRFADPAAHEKGHRLIAEYLANGNRLRVEPKQVTIVELIAAYTAHVEATYKRPDGSPSQRSIDNISLAMVFPKSVYGATRAVEFGPLALRACIAHWVNSGLRRTTVNKRLGDLKRCFKWATSMEMIPPSVYQALSTVEGLRHGRCTAKESRIVTAVPEAHVFALRDHVARPVWGLIMLQWFTGARSGEVLNLRRCDIDTEGEVWRAKIAIHKTTLKGKTRTLYFGPQAQAILTEAFEGKSPFEPLFSPKEAERERYAACKSHGHHNRPPKPRKSDRTLRDAYCTDTYRRAIAEACKKAEIPQWHPHQLRHACATRIEQEFGLAAAACWLGHADVSITRTYAKLDQDQAVHLARKVG